MNLESLLFFNNYERLEGDYQNVFTTVPSFYCSGSTDDERGCRTPFYSDGARRTLLGAAGASGPLPI